MGRPWPAWRDPEYVGSDEHRAGLDELFGGPVSDEFFAAVVQQCNDMNAEYDHPGQDWLVDPLDLGITSPETPDPVD